MEPKVTQGFGINNTAVGIASGGLAGNMPYPCQGPQTFICSPEEDARSLLFQRAFELEQQAAGLRLIASMVPTSGVLGYDARDQLLAAAKAIAGKGK